MTPKPLSTRGTLLTTGFVTLDVILDGARVGHRAGGTAGNVAANLAFLGWKTSVAALVGQDPAGRRLQHDLRRSGVDTSHLVVRDDVVTPVVIHEVFDGGHRFRFGCPTCGRRFPRHRPIPNDMARTLLARQLPSVFFFDRASRAAIAIAEAVRDTGGLVMFEPGTRGHEQSFKRALDLAHIIKFSHDKKHQFEDALSAPRSGQLQIMTAGERGAFWRRTRTWHRVAGIESTIVDAGGAGDWTTAGILASMQSLRPDAIAVTDTDYLLRWGQALGVLSCGVIGARGLSSVMSPKEVVEAASKLVERERTTPANNHRLRASRRQAECPACLSAHHAGASSR